MLSLISSSQKATNKINRIVLMFKISFFDYLISEIKCPDYVPNGIVHNNCSYTVGSVCTFDCNDRHNRNGDISKISCLPSGKWDKIHDKIPLCIGRFILF